MSPFQIPTRGQHISKEKTWQAFDPNWCSLDMSFAKIGSSHQTRDLECFADSRSIPWNPPTILGPDLIATIPQMSLLSLCALLSQQSHSFLICVALTYNDSRLILHKLCQILRNASVNDFWFPGRLEELLQALLCFLRSFCLTWVGLYPLSSQVLYHDSVSMIMPRFYWWSSGATDLYILGCLLDAMQSLWIVLVRKIDEDSGGSVTCDTQLNCRALFTIAPALLSSPFFGFLFGCSSTFLCRKWALCAELTSRFSFIEFTFGRMPILYDFTMTVCVLVSQRQSTQGLFLWWLFGPPTAFLRRGSRVPWVPCRDPREWCEYKAATITCWLESYCSLSNTHKAIWCKYLSRSMYMAVDWTSQTGFCLWHFFFSTHFYLAYLKIVAQRVVRLLVSASHDRYSHAGRYIGLLSNTGLFLSTGNRYLFLLQRHSFPYDFDHCSCFISPVPCVKVS